MKITNQSGLSTVLFTCVLAWIAAVTPAQANTVGIQQIAFSKDSTQILYITNRFGEGQRSPTPVIRFIHSQSGLPMTTTKLNFQPQQQLLMGFTPDGFKTAILDAKGLNIVHNQTGETLRTLPVPNLPSPLIA